MNQQLLSEQDDVDDVYSQERSDAIKDIIAGVHEVGDLVTDLNIIVSSHNVHIDEIDYNFTETEVNTQKAVKETTKAATEEPFCQKSIRYTTCGLGTLVTGLSVLLIGKFVLFR